ncbi:MAG: hypothetical protein AAFO69_17700, partial [Bacteroidota bacterium]
DAASSEDHLITYFDAEKGESITFNSMDELVTYFEGTEHYEMVSQKIASFQQERAYVEEHKLFDLPEDHPTVVEYMERFEGPSIAQVEVAFGGFLWDGLNASGDRLSSTSGPAPVIRRRWRNRASSVGGGISGGSLFLCDRTWFRGPINFVLVAPLISTNLNDNFVTADFNNRTESFY